MLYNHFKYNKGLELVINYWWVPLHAIARGISRAEIIDLTTDTVLRLESAPIYSMS